MSSNKIVKFYGKTLVELFIFVEHAQQMSNNLYINVLLQTCWIFT